MKFELSEEAKKNGIILKSVANNGPIKWVNGPSTQQTYTLPDGTVEFNRPTDGQEFRLWIDPHQTDVFIWDDSSATWKYNHSMVGKLAPARSDCSGSHTQSPATSPNEIKIPVCECGKEKHGFANHSSWCDLYNT